MLVKPIEIKTLKYQGKIVFEKVIVPSFKRIPKLFNEKEACFMFIDKGEFIARTPYEVISFEEGSGMLAKCFNYFIETNIEQRKQHNKIELIGVLLYPELVRDIFPYPTTQKSNNNYNINKIQVDAMLLNFKESINLLIENPTMADDILILNKLKEFIILISKTTNSESELSFLTDIFSPFNFDFKKTIEQNIYTNLSLKELARLCNMSLSTFNRNFRKIYQESPKKYFTQKKLEKASNLLRTPDIRMAEVAHDCGFESIATFNRVFQQFFKKSPTQFIADIK